MNRMKRAWAVVATAALLSAGGASAGQQAWLETTSALGKAGALPQGKLSKQELDRLTEIGEQLFKAKFTVGDGAGRPMATQAIIPTRARARSDVRFTRMPGPDANACAGCHNDPVTGGAGDFVTNVFVSEGFANANFDTSDPQFSNERGSNHLFGAGLIELLAREMTVELQTGRSQALSEASLAGKPVTVELSAKGVSFGRITALPDGIVELDAIEGVDSDLVVRPFSQKGVMTSLRQFTVNAMNHHHGMQAVERFGDRWTGTSDFDQDEYADELSPADISALVAWQATLPAPQETIPDDAEWREAAGRGAGLMAELGCGTCHIPALPLKSLEFRDPGPLDAAGTLNDTQVASSAIYDLALLDWAKKLPRNEKGEVMVPLHGDLKRHTMTDSANEQLGNELLSQRFVDRNIFITAELWGVASTAPYGHRNDFTTLDAIIRAHGGEARDAAKRYADASDSDRSAIIAYLKTMEIVQ